MIAKNYHSRLLADFIVVRAIIIARKALESLYINNKELFWSAFIRRYRYARNRAKQSTSYPSSSSNNFFFICYIMTQIKYGLIGAYKSV